MNTILRKDKRIAAYILVYYIIQTINNFINSIFSGSTLWFYFSRLILFIFLIIAIWSIIKTKSHIVVISFSLLLICFLVTLILGNEDQSYFYTLMVNALFILLPLGLCVYCIYDLEILITYLFFASVPCAFLMIITSIIAKDTGYSMTVGYNLTFWLMIVIEHFFVNKNIWLLIISVLSFVAIVFFGSRGAIACLGIYWLLNIIISKIQLQKKIIIILIVFIVSIVIVLNYEIILSYIYNLARSFGFQARTLRTILIGTFTDTSSRVSVQNYYINGINMNPLFGYGIVGAWAARGSYPHNIFLELLYSFGIVLGAFLCLALVILVFTSLKKGSHFERRILLVFISSSCLLLFSGSFVESPDFYILIFLCFRIAFERGIKERQLLYKRK